jgi:hypothetical protein
MTHANAPKLLVHTEGDILNVCSVKIGLFKIIN